MGYLSASFADLVNVIASPTAAFRSLRERPIVAFPLLLLVIVWAAMWIWYYGAVDFEWMKSYVIGVETLKSSAQEREAISQSISSMKPGAFAVISIIGVAIVMLGVSLVMATYLVIVDAVLDDKLGFRHWLTLALWSLVPSLFTVLAMTANFLMSEGNRVAPDQLNPITLDNLIFHVGSGSPFHSMLTLDLATLWSWALLVIGYRVWTERSVGSSIAIVMAPIFVVYGVWISVVLLSKPG